MSARGDHWGWHQLDSRWARRLVDHADIRRGDLVVDIGAGEGAITDALLAAGAHVVAIELHARRAARLRARFSGRRVTVVEADASALRLPGRPFKVVANPPFAITTSVLRRLTNPRSHLASAVIVLPMWASVRWASGRGVGGITSRQLFSIGMGPRVPARASTPAPPAAVGSVIITRSASGPRSR